MSQQASVSSTGNLRLAQQVFTAAYSWPAVAVGAWTG